MIYKINLLKNTFKKLLMKLKNIKKNKKYN